LWIWGRRTAIAKLLAGAVGGTMGDDVVLDTVVDIAGKDTAFQQVLFGAVGTEADDACRPGGCEAGDFGQFVDGGAVDIDAGRRGRWRFGVGLLKPCDGGRLSDGWGTEEYSQKQKFCGVSHGSILDLRLNSRKAPAQNAGMSGAQRSR